MSARRDDPHFVARLRAASDAVLLARIDEAREIVSLVRAGRACHADWHREIRAALRRGDRAYGIQLAIDTGLTPTNLLKTISTRRRQRDG